MTKVKQVRGASKESIKHLKNGSVHKNKHQKFKKTPTGKVTLINGSQKKNNNKTKQPQNGSNPPKQKKSPKSVSQESASPKNVKNLKKSLKTKPQVADEEDDSSSDVDYNEGITIKEIVSATEDAADTSSDDDDDDVPDIFGTSLAEETDDDDDEFDGDSDDDDEAAVENKGVKMFKGLESKSTSEESSDDDDEDAKEVEEDENDDEDDDSDVDTSLPTVKDLLGESIADESDDEDFVGNEDVEESDDDMDSDEEVDQSLNSSTQTASTEEDDEDEDESDDDDDEESDDDVTDDETSPDVTAILGESLAEESDDEDFEGDDDDDASDDEDGVPQPSTKVTRSKKSKDEDANEVSGKSKTVKDAVENPQLITKAEKEERNRRTIFVGNVPKTVDQSQIKTTFKKFGPIDTIRLRGVVAANPHESFKVAAIKKDFHPKSACICYFVTFKDEESVEKALSMNGKKLEGNYLRVDRATITEETRDNKRSVFLGNLPFQIEDNVIWDAFKDCGRIESVRIIRDRKSGTSRGFGYINFATADGVALAMDLNGTKIGGREVRVQASSPEKKSKKSGKKRQNEQLTSDEQEGSPKKPRTLVTPSVVAATRNSVNAERRTDNIKKKRSQGEKQRVKSESSSPQNKSPNKFQGQKADAKKKFKPDKSAKKKKHMAAKLLAKPKKPAKQ